MALTDVIANELLKTLETDTDPQTVVARYAGSKGPLYGALARATRDATARYATLQQRVTRARSRVIASEHRAQGAEARAGRTEDATQAAEHRLAAIHANLTQHQDIWQQVKALAAAGWTADALATLTTIFTRATAENGQPPEEVVAHCLAVMQEAADLAAAEQQVRTAQDQARQAEAAAVAKAQAAKVRAQAVDAAAWCMRHGIGAHTLTAWQAIATALDGPAADLAQGVATALERYGSLEVALTAVHDNGAARVAAAETAAVAAIRTTAQRAQQTLEGLDAAVAAALERVAALEREASTVRQYVNWARALVDPDPAAWDGVGPETWLTLFGRWQQWVHRHDVTVEVPLPADLAPALARQAQFPTVYGSLRLSLPTISTLLAQAVAALVVQDRPATRPVLPQEGRSHA